MDEPVINSSKRTTTTVKKIYKDDGAKTEFYSKKVNLNVKRDE